MSATDPLPQRDALAERILLDRSQRLARLTVASWPSTVEARLEAGQQLYGDAWAERTTARLLDEIADEAIDLAAWGCLAARSLDGAGLDPDVIATVGEMVSRAVGAAAEAHAYVVAAQAALRKASR